MVLKMSCMANLATNKKYEVSLSAGSLILFLMATIGFHGDASMN